MKKFLIVAGVLLLGGIVTYSYVKGKYNNLVNLQEPAKRSWSDVQTEYQRRNDLVPNFVSTVQGAANFEQQTLTDVVEARAKATQPQINAESLLNNPQAFQQFQQAQDNLGAALGRLLVVVEKYPELKANQNFLDLQAQLESTENRISNARRVYSNTVQKYNATRRNFPDNVFAAIFGFQEMPYFEASAAAQTAPKVDFSQPKQ